MYHSKQTAAEVRSEVPALIKLPTRVISYAWGESYVDQLLSLTVPALLAPGNLPYLASQVSCEVFLLTEERFFERLLEHPAIVRLRTICPLRLIGLDDLITAPDKKYGMALTYALHRGFSDLGPAMTDHWQIFLNADFILADGSLRNLLTHLMRGERLVASPSYCVTAHQAQHELLKRMDFRTCSLSVSPREMAKLALRYRHNTIRGKTVNQRDFHIRYTEQFYWLIDDTTMLGHQMPIAIVGMRPECYVKEPNSYWDHGLMREFCPNAQLDVIGDSDEFLMIELREKDVAQDQIILGSPDARELGERMISWVTSYQRDFASYPLTLHAANLPANIDEARKNLRAFVEEVLSYVPRHLPSHLNHPQWNYHWTGFVEARHKFLSSRLGMLTHTTEPPGHLSEFDRAWWKFDGHQKVFTRQRAAMTELMTRQLELIQNAIGDAERDQVSQLKEFDRRFREEFTKTAVDLRMQGDDIFTQVSFGQDADVKSGESDECVRMLKRCEDEYFNLQQKFLEKQEKLRQTLQAVNKYYPERIRALDREFDRVRARYLVMTAKDPAAPATPFLRMRRGPAVRRNEVRGSLVGRLARKMYHDLYGWWPRVSKFSPYWGALRHLHRLTDDATARGATDVLFVGDRSDIVNTIVNLSGLHAWMSVAGMKMGSLGGTFVEPPQFDICICDLDFGDLLQFSEIDEAVRRFMRPGGTIIAFYLNLDVAVLPITSHELSDIFAGIPHAQIFYAGSDSSARLLRAFRSALSLQLRYSAIVLGALAVRLALIAPQAWFSNVLEARVSKKRQSLPPILPISITIESRVPELKDDDNMVA
jgi:hypothetical protein